MNPNCQKKKKLNEPYDYTPSLPNQKISPPNPKCHSRCLDHRWPSHRFAATTTTIVRSAVHYHLPLSHCFESFHRRDHRSQCRRNSKNPKLEIAPAIWIIFKSFNILQAHFLKFYCRFHLILNVCKIPPFILPIPSLCALPPNLSDLVQANLGIQASKTGRLQLSDISDDAPNILISARIPFKPDVAFVSKSSKFYFKNQGKRQEPYSNYERGAIGVVIVIQGRATLLAYLNEEAKVVHHDVKSSSILLDRKWNASVSDLKACLTIGI
ncbi:hypothetical protein CASFOL_001602 [Castilleja foliolosa]|uniref:Protein kinase domain-containing protein n=1 Tax=Castilleja foliolosa TaxID=1961234 RepID=A0ABD3EJL8_9LAMI